MKKLLLIAIAVVFASCNEPLKDYVTLTGKITNKNGDNIIIRTRTYSKTIPLNEDGTFKDTLKVEAGIYNLFDGKESTYLFLKNGHELNITIDTKEFDETVTYTGIGYQNSTYFAKKNLLEEATFTAGLLDLDEDAFKSKISDAKNKFTELLNSFEELDSTLYANESESLSKMEDGLLGMYQSQKARSSQFEKLVGQPSPSFENYENFKGGTTSLSDLKGKYVYVDVWATWCGPCKREIPFLKEVEHNYEGKDIQFVSISIDKKADHEKWKSMVKDKELGGIQLFADDNWKSQFVRDYQIDGIPRFILIDPQGNIVSADAPRPSSPKLIELFNKLEI